MRTTAITTNMSTRVLWGMTRIPNAPSSEMSTAARKAPGMLPMPPTTTTTNTAARMLKSMRRSAPPFGSWAAPPRPASIDPRKKVPVNSTPG